MCLFVRLRDCIVTSQECQMRLYCNSFAYSIHAQENHCNLCAFLASLRVTMVLNRKMCPHGKHKYICKLCVGNGICEHGERKGRCKLCSGSALCPHRKRKDSCTECQNHVCTVDGCPKYGFKYCSSWALKYHMETAHANNPEP